MFTVKPPKRDSAASSRRLVSRLCSAVLLFVGLSLVSACGPQIEEPAPEPDPMEMRRYYPAPKWEYQISPAVRLVNPSTPSGQRKPMIIASNVYELPEEAALAAKVSDEQIELSLDGRDYLQNRKVGDIVISKENGVHWRRIKEVRREGGKIRWTTERAQITDVFQKAHFYLQIDTRKIDPADLPDLDLALPYLKPDQPPALMERRGSGMHSSDNCPKAPPACNGPASEETVCVLSANPQVACPMPTGEGCESLLSNMLGHQCEPRPACVVNNGDPNTMEACPEEDRDSCNSPGGACRPVYTCELRDAIEFYSTYHADDPVVFPDLDINTTFPSSYGPFAASEFQCAPIAGRQACIVKTCTSSNPNACTDQFSEADGETGYACNTSDLLPGSQCTDSGEECSQDSDCCSASCGSFTVDKLDEHGQPVFDENGDVVTEVVQRCQPAESGFCSRACNKEAKDAGYDSDGFLANALKELILGEAADFIKDMAFDASFKPDIRFELEIDWFKVERLGLIIGADFLTRIGITFDWSIEKDFHWKNNKQITIVTFAILGYPFSVKINLHGEILFTVSGTGTFEPQYVFYTHKNTGETWSEDNNQIDDPPQGYVGEELPGVWDSSSDEPGMAIGMIWQSDGSPCNDSEFSDYEECDPVKTGSKFYKLSRNHNNDIFDPGVNNQLDASASAQFGVEVSLWQGVPDAAESKLIGVEPFNVLATAYASVHSPFCAIGASLYYRMFISFGPLIFFGEEILGEIKFPVLVRKIFGLDWLIPQDFGCEGGPDQHFMCDVANLLGCGYPPVDIAPSEAPLACDSSTDCAPDERCVNASCISQPDGALRISMSWEGRSDLDLYVQPLPSGQTLSKTPSTTAADGTCGAEGCFQPTCGGPDAEAPADGTGVNCRAETKYVESLLIDQPSAERYKIWVINNGGTDSAFGGGFNIEIEHGDHVQHVSGLLPASGPDDTQMTPMYFIYEIPDGN